MIQQLGQQLEQIVGKVEGASSVYAERVAGGRYVKVDIDRLKAARYGLNIADVQAVLATAVGGGSGPDHRGARALPHQPALSPELSRFGGEPRAAAGGHSSGARIALADVARVYISEAPMLRSENARLNGWVYVDIRGRDIGSFVAEAKAEVDKQLVLPAGYALTWSGPIRVHGAGQGPPSPT